MYQGETLKTLPAIFDQLFLVEKMTNGASINISFSLKVELQPSQADIFFTFILTVSLLSPISATGADHDGPQKTDHLTVESRDLGFYLHSSSGDRNLS